MSEEQDTNVDDVANEPASTPEADTTVDTPENEPTATPDNERTWFGDDAPPEEGAEQPPALPDDGRALPEWVPGQYHDPAMRQQLLEVLGFKAEDVANQRPEWLDERFKSPEDLAQSYRELEQKLHSRSNAPEEYDIRLPEGANELSDDDMAMFKDLGLSNDSAQKLVDYFQENIVPSMTQQKAQIEQQQLASAWGMTNEDGSVDEATLKTRLGEVKKWADRNVPEGVVKELSRTASGVQQLYDLMRNKRGAADAPKAPQAESLDELQSMVNDDRYWTDEAFRNKVNRKFQRAFDS